MNINEFFIETHIKCIGQLGHCSSTWEVYLLWLQNLPSNSTESKVDCQRAKCFWRIAIWWSRTDRIHLCCWIDLIACKLPGVQRVLHYSFNYSLNSSKIIGFWKFNLKIHFENDCKFQVWNFRFSKIFSQIGKNL